MKQVPVKNHKTALVLAFTVFIANSAWAANSKDGQTLRPIPDTTAVAPQPVKPATVKSATAKPAIAKSATASAAIPSNSKSTATGVATSPPSAKVAAAKMTGPTPVDKTVKKVVKKSTSSASRGPSMVPPPPPNTPSMLIDPSGMGMSMSGMYGMPVEYMSKEALKDRLKEISIQYKDAAAELESRKRLKAEVQERAKNFEQLYAEGVVSRRELETSQREANDTQDDTARLENKYNELKNLLDRMNKRMGAAAATGGTHAPFIIKNKTTSKSRKKAKQKTVQPKLIN